MNSSIVTYLAFNNGIKFNGDLVVEESADSPPKKPAEPMEMDISHKINALSCLSAISPANITVSESFSKSIGNGLKQRAEWIQNNLLSEGVTAPVISFKQKEQMVANVKKKSQNGILSEEEKIKKTKELRRLSAAKSRQNKKEYIKRLQEENTTLRNKVEQISQLDSEIKENYQSLELLTQTISKIRYKTEKSPEEQASTKLTRKEKNCQSAARSRERENKLLSTLIKINELLKKQFQTIQEKNSE